MHPISIRLKNQAPSFSYPMVLLGLFFGDGLHEVFTFARRPTAMLALVDRHSDHDSKVHFEKKPGGGTNSAGVGTHSGGGPAWGGRMASNGGRASGGTASGVASQHRSVFLSRELTTLQTSRNAASKALDWKAQIFSAMQAHHCLTRC
jgi:hypothetical protein